MSRSVFATDIKYGYFLNVQHPEISRRMTAYRKAHGIPVDVPLSDEERADFEKDVMRELTPAIERFKRRMGVVKAK